jgi:hypothetical protein
MDPDARAKGNKPHVNGRAASWRCAACGAQFDESAWQSLRLTARLDPDEVSRLVRGWSQTQCIEVRQCAGCGKAISAKRTVRDR